ncbi:PE-PPE domain-containing protein [Nocardia sp. NPDC088792]|uniref:PE-PPE domain-containing protein n=1 Tax=Nocardia sp. NPDC088792 TaxID=3364332 RepID=UPI00380A15C6
MIDVITCRGTGEPLNGTTNMLPLLTEQLDPTKYTIGVDLDYSASVGPANPQEDLAGVSEDDSVAAGVTALAAAIRATPLVVGIAGYSLGAMVVTRFLEAKAAGEYADCEVAWAATVANPLRAEGSSIDPAPVGFGLAGQHGPWPDGIPVWEAANPADAITSCPADSPLRTLADAVSEFSFADLGGWTSDLIDRVLANRWQPTDIGSLLHPIATWRLWSQTAALMEGYAFGGQHTSAYIVGGYIDRLSSAINAA